MLACASASLTTFPSCSGLGCHAVEDRAEPLSYTPRSYAFHNFISEEEADHIIRIARPFVSWPCASWSGAAGSLTSSVTPAPAEEGRVVPAQY